ncbi:hypothetical protein BK133_16760 [Paenibacillus sp. FSL H8-0548]|uniref:nucleotidyltransferase domain-containing protein n=1 Tax=Paenibacillus sp. FSL H8-0548 TaxID=1920422 RepID=UPI00096D19EB|nr:nucleotidyltransferase family protein [Paenibacillus sp. FSL H8-0548]OMF30785.1 hypothetical protein BK133_16760 [Paenibacillus sp. FSL H8-0548]
MDDSTNYFLSLLGSFIHEREPLERANIDWEQIYRLGSIHSVSGIMYLMASKQGAHGPDEQLRKRMKQDFASTLIRAAEQENEVNKVIEQLRHDKIVHVLIKGYGIKGCYPVEEMRTMGDIDILIKPEDREKSHLLLKAMGFHADHTIGDVWNYSKGDVHLEIHTRLFDHNINHKYDYITYFSRAWDHVVLKPGEYTGAFSAEYHLLYLFVHMAKHCYGTGCGVRMVMDIAIYVAHYDTVLDWSYIDQELEKLQLSLFAQNIWILCQKWFEVNSPLIFPVMEEDYDEGISEYILSAGTFGISERNSLIHGMRKVYTERKGAKEIVALRLFLPMCFPSYNVLCEIPEYSMLKNRPLLLPAAWIYRIGRILFLKGKRTWRMLMNIVKGSKEFGEQYEVISKLGL